jgi:hypothetical protein
MSFDIVIPLGPNEISRFSKQIQCTKKNVIGYRNIYIVTCNLNITIDDCIVIDENIFPFKNFISAFFAQHNGKNNRNGWYFQQLIKLYAGVYINDILENYLVIDSDVFFLKPIQFIENNKPIFSTSDENHIPYFKHINLLHNSFNKYCNKSGICHHMLFNKKYINELFAIVEEFHKKPFWQAFILSVNEHFNHNITAAESGASEYELYFNYMFKNYKDTIVIRNLNWVNISKATFDNNLNNFNYDYVSVCAYLG